MGLRAKILSFTRTVIRGAKVSLAKVDTGGGANVTAEHYSAPGDDSFPLDTDMAYASPVPRSGGLVVVGYLDPNSEPKAQVGEKRIYARKENGDLSVEVWLKNDESVIIANENGVFELQADGTFLINGAKITPGGDFVTAAGVSLNNHPHNQANDGGGNVEQPTEPPTATE